MKPTRLKRTLQNMKYKVTAQETKISAKPLCYQSFFTIVVEAKDPFEAKRLFKNKFANIEFCKKSFIIIKLSKDIE